jgi:hypothetical protein
MTKADPDPLGLRQPDRGQRWRDDAQKFEEECAEERRRREQALIRELAQSNWGDTCAIVG